MPEFFTVLGIIIAVIVLGLLFTLSLRGTLTVAYDGEFSLSFKVLFFNIRLLPQRERKKQYRRSMSRRRAKRIRRSVELREARKREFWGNLFGKKEKKEESKPEPEKKTDDKKSSVDIPIKLVARETIDILSTFTEIIAIVVKRFTHRLRIRIARFKIKIATEDPALTAVTYGAATGVINVLLPILKEVENLGLPKEENFDITYDFVSDTPDIDMKVSFSLRTWHIADIALCSLLGGLSKYVNRKGGIDKTFESISNLIEAFSPKGDPTDEKNLNNHIQNERN